MFIRAAFHPAPERSLKANLNPDERLSPSVQQQVEVLVQTPRRAAPIPTTRRMFAALSSSNYRLIFSGSLLSNIGTWMQRMAQSWLLFSITGSAFYLGLDAFASDFPVLLFSLLGGVVADRMNRKRLLLWTQAVQLLLAAALAGLTYSGRVQPWHIITTSLLFGCVQAFNVPAYLSLLPTLVPRQELSSAIALNSFQFNVSRVVGPALAGIFLLKRGAAFCFFLNSVSFLAVIVSLAWMRGVAGPPPSRTSASQSLAQGAEYVRRHPVIQVLLLTIFVFSFCAAPLLTLLPLFAKDVLRSGPTAFSQLLSLFGLGAVLGTLWVAGAATLKRRIDLAISTIALFVGCAFTFAASRSLALSSVIALVAGASIIGSNVILNAMVQNEAPNPLRGRIMSMYGLAFRGGMPLGNLLTGMVAQKWGGPVAIIVQGVLISVYIADFMLFFRRHFTPKQRQSAG